MAADQEIGPPEPPQVRSRLVAFVAAGIIAALVAVAFGLQLIFPDRIGVMSVERHPFPEPGVVTDERSQRLALEARQRADLEGANGRMPIAAAMKSIAERGSRAFDPLDAKP